MDNKKYYAVKNRSAGTVVYRIPEDGIRREFIPGETKQISYEELLKLSYRPGGRKLMANYLTIQSQEVTSSLNIHTEPEYWMDEQKIVDLIKNGSLDAWKDFLDFAPVGAIDLAKNFCVNLPLNDVAKRDALKVQTGFDVTAAIALNKADKEDEGVQAKETPKRRVQTAEPTPGRRTTPTYNVTKREEKTAE